ncbi:insecticidal toxin complex protein TccB [Mycetohabitans sp. B2]|uniref:Tc toxin subunit A-related protein n=1 Tax=Mycetohabitans sp. B2 TaxID=2841274 RepID=UPI001F474864|nr:neuraminidase-like domain-containing protein [Mycetohabitans sp. B2]MCF7695960.1 insecticidal toxin complex protein TccB [Mycetohabitans sp. B2]
MLSTIEKQLNESQRDALVTGYLNFVAPTLKNVGSQPVTDENLYEYLLIDPEVGDEVKTSRVAQAIASVQQYITRIVNGVEPGFQAVEPSTVNAWRDNDSQYAIWAAGADVQNYAENYISPATRLEKSHYFKELETTLNQNQLDPDHVQNAALAYLNEFEAVSNLTVLSGYINQDNFSRATYYLIGRTTTKPYQYYWRQMDLSKNRDDYQGNPVTPNCWSDWLPIDLPLSADGVLEHTVRPVFYNDRLYVAWVERDPTPQKNDSGKNTTQHAYRVAFGYKRYDDSWTAPNSTTLMTLQQGETDELQRNSLLIDEASDIKSLRDVNLLATTDFSIDPADKAESNPYGRLMLGVFARQFDAKTKKNAPTVYGYQYCDSAFNRHALGPLTRELLFASFIDQDDTTNALQFAVYDKKYVMTGVERNTDKEAGGDQENTGWNSKIPDLQIGDTGNCCVYMKDPLTVRVEMGLSDSFTNDYVFTKEETNTGGNSGFGFCRPNDDWGVTIRYHDNDYYTFENTVIRYEPNSFGQGSIPDGVRAINISDAPGNSVTQFRVDIQSNQIRWTGSGAYGPSLDISGTRLDEDCNAVNYAIGMKAYAPFDFDSWASLAQISNFDKIADTRKFFLSTEISGSAGGVGYKDDPNPTFELDPKSANLAQEITLSESLFKPTERYLNVGLKVVWDHYDRPTGNKGGHAWVWKWFKVSVEMQDLNAPTAIPRLVSRYDSKRGMVQYLDFCTDDLPANTRLNTTFVRTLIEKANLGLDSLLDYTVQADPTLEASLTEDGKSEAMDFNGANGLYFWELFFHMPFLVASRFASGQQFDPAQKWLHYIFDPAMSKKDNAPPYWNVYPLKPLSHLAGDPSRLLADPLDPDTQAYAHPEVYQKAVFVAYVSNLIAQGDAWYRQLTRDGLAQARVYYNFAVELLGPRPDVSISSNWQAPTLDTLAQADNTALRTYERDLGRSNASLPALPGRHTGYLRLADNQYFTAPLNTLMLSHWDTIDARLYNLRHNLTVDGKPLSLPLYAAPADPVALLSQRAQSGMLSAGVSGAMLVVPPYRFNAMLPRAYNAVATLSRFGETLLSLLERSERAGQEELAQQQLLDMSSYAMTLQQQAIDGLVADRVALQASQTTAQQRHDHYYALYQENISDAERQVMDTNTLAQTYFASAQALQVASGALKEVPSIYGLADGGSRYEGATEAVGAVMQLEGHVATLLAERLATTEGYRRRRQDWQLQYEQAQAEVDALTKQLDALAIREKSARTALQQAQAQQAQLQTMLTYLKSRFTQATLYQWLSGQLAAQYYQAYDAVVSLCLSAQACWQYELGDFATTFIQTGTWNDHYRGLQVGETLQLNLHQMEAAYLARHERRLEITRTVSLKTLLTNNTFEAQKSRGSFTFELTEALFDNDYPGHYLRQILSVSVTLPTVVGPYQDVKAVLTQISSSTLLKADIQGVDYLNGKGNVGANVVNNLRPSQQVAISTGLNDAGSVNVRFDDERYRPFEGTGAVSKWTLTFPRAVDSQGGQLKADPEQQALLAALDDVLVQVQYSACVGGASFADAVEKSLLPSGL